MQTLSRTFLCLLIGLLSQWACAQDLPTKFDPQRDAARDLATATAMAKAQGKRVLVDVGGEWCKWCHILDRFVAAQPDINSLIASRYVWVKVNWSPENKNVAVLSRWPKIQGYPHLFVLDDEGKLLHSQDTGRLETNDSYHPQRFLAFLKEHADVVVK
jgi:thiol:disulfide interchange protein